MPELGEVEFMCRKARATIGRALVEVRPGPHGNPAAALLGGQRLVDVGRRGKALIFAFEEEVVIWQPRMTGRVVFAGAAQRETDVTATWRFDGEHVWRFEDRRRLGRWTVVERAALPAHLHALGWGPECWPGRSASWWQKTLQSSRRSIKETLLDPRWVVGIGNMVATELLWRACVSPWERPAGLSPHDWERVARATDQVVDEIIAELETLDCLTLVHVHGSPLPQAMSVYGRPHAPCPRCSHPLASAPQGGRTTVYCVRCQNVR